MRRLLLATTLLIASSGFAQASHFVELTWTASPSGGAASLYRAGHICPPPSGFTKIASGISGTTYQDGPPIDAGDYCYVATTVADGKESAPSNMAQVTVPASGCSATSTFDPTKPGQLTVCDPVPPGPACILSVAGASTLCRINGTLNISENAAPFHPLYVAPVEVFRFYAPTNLVIGPSTAIYIGTLIAGGHNPDMVYLAPNACTLTKVVYDTRTNGAVTTPVTISFWDVTQNVAIPNAATTQTWNGWVQETVAAPSFAVAASDQLQVRFSTPKTLPPGFYLNLTVTAYCTDK